MAEMGNIKISNEVVAIISGIAAMEVKGVHSMSGSFADGITTILGRRNLGKGVKVEGIVTGKQIGRASCRERV